MEPITTSTESVRRTMPIARASLARIVFAASLGTCFEAYDLFLVGIMAVVLSQQFFSNANPAAALIFTLLGFAAGYLVRPLGAVVFGRIGDRLGRKRVFVAAVAMMGVSTCLIGVLPTYASVGIYAPVMFLALRLTQGFALGGEAGGAMVYVVEHAPPHRRGLYTSWVQLAPCAGLLLSQCVVYATRTLTSEGAFTAWAWRIPFLASLVLLALSIWIRTRMSESPEFDRLRRDGTLSRAPLRETFTGRRNLVAILFALFALGPGAAVATYTALFYTPFFLTQVLHVDANMANLLSSGALLLAMPLYVAFGALSDRIGRKPIICAGFLLVAITYPAIFRSLTHFANPALEVAQASAPVTLIANPHECSTQLDVLGTTKAITSCDVAKAALVRFGVDFKTLAAPDAATTIIKIGERSMTLYDGSISDAKQGSAVFSASLRAALSDAGYPQKGDPAKVNRLMVLLLLCTVMLFSAMTYGPLAAALSELFPTRVRFTALSLSYHLGYGWTGGFLPAMAFAIVAATGNMYAGLNYPRLIALVGVVGTLIFAAISSRPNHEIPN